MCARGVAIRGRGGATTTLTRLGAAVLAVGPRSSGHVPYRDSKLTRMLQSSLGGHARVGVICTLSPSEKAMEESHNTLKFAARAKNIVIDPRKNAIEDDKTLLQRYRNEVADLRRQLSEVKEKLAATESSVLQPDGDVSRASSLISLTASSEMTSSEAGLGTIPANEVERLLAEKADVRARVHCARRVSRPADTRAWACRDAHENAQMQEELNQQSLLQMTLQAKIDHLTKVILTSTSVASAAPSTPQVRAANRCTG